MKTTVQRRLALLAGLLLLSSIAIAAGAATAQAATVAGAGAASGAAPAATFAQSRAAAYLRAHDRGFVATVPAVTAPAATQGSTAVGRGVRAGRSAADIPAAQPGSSGASAASAWIFAALAAAALAVIAVWALVRRRRQPNGRPSAAYCAQHPDDPLCTTT
jgi:cobalamin biosynthesis Mg chelatase CobN